MDPCGEADRRAGVEILRDLAGDSGLRPRGLELSSQFETSPLGGRSAKGYTSLGASTFGRVRSFPEFALANSKLPEG